MIHLVPPPFPPFPSCRPNIPSHSRSSLHLRRGIHLPVRSILLPLVRFGPLLHDDERDDQERERTDDAEHQDHSRLSLRKVLAALGEDVGVGDGRHSGGS